MQSDFSRVVIKKVRIESIVVPVPTSEINLVEETLGTFIAGPTHLIKTILKNYKVYFIKGY